MLGFFARPLPFRPFGIPIGLGTSKAMAAVLSSTLFFPGTMTTAGDDGVVGVAAAEADLDPEARCRVSERGKEKRFRRVLPCCWPSSCSGCCCCCCCCFCVDVIWVGVAEGASAGGGAGSGRGAESATMLVVVPGAIAAIPMPESSLLSSTTPPAASLALGSRSGVNVAPVIVARFGAYNGGTARIVGVTMGVPSFAATEGLAPGTGVEVRDPRGVDGCEIHALRLLHLAAGWCAGREKRLRLPNFTDDDADGGSVVPGSLWRTESNVEPRVHVFRRLRVVLLAEPLTKGRAAALDEVSDEPCPRPGTMAGELP